MLSRETRRVLAVILLGLSVAGMVGCSTGLPGDARESEPRLSDATAAALSSQKPRSTEGDPLQPPSLRPGEGSDIPHQILVQSESTVGHVVTPALFVAGNRSEAASFAAWLEGEAAQRVERADFGAEWVVAFFRGRMGSSGYGVNVQSLRLVREGVRLEVSLTEPDPNRNVMTVESVPYLVLLVPRRGLALPNLVVWSAYDTEGNLLAETRHP